MVIRRLLKMIAYCFNQRFQNFFERDWNLNWWTSCDPSRTVARKCSVGGLYIFSGGLDVCAGGLTLFIYSISYFNLGGLGALFGGLNPPKPPRGDETGPKSQKAYLNMTKMLIVWIIFGSRLLSVFSVSAVSSVLKYLRYTTNRHANKFEELQLRFRFWSPRRNLFSDPLRNRNLFGSRPILWEPLASMLKPVKTLLTCFNL